MHVIAIKDIIIAPNRQRREFEPQVLMELTESIRDRGLLHPVVLRQSTEGLVLVAGERRLRAIIDLHAFGDSLRHNDTEVAVDHIPYTTLGELSELDAEEAELDENLRRRDLTWQEHAEAVQRLHRLRIMQRAQQPGSGTHTIAQTAVEVRGSAEGSFQGKTRKEIIVAQYLDDPDVAKAKTLDEGFKILRQKEEGRKSAELAESVGRTFSSADHKLINDDCLVFMASTTARYDVILTDPSYGMGAHLFNDGGGKMIAIEHHYDDSPAAWIQLMAAWCPLSFLVAKPQAHAYVFCDIDHFHELRAMMTEAGWNCFRTPLIYHKPNSGRVPWPEHGPRRQYELCLFAVKGKKQVTHIYPDVISAQDINKTGHGASKPVPLYTNLLQRSIKPGDHVLDCFAGTGTIIPACHALQCYATAVESSQEYFGQCLQRLTELEVSP